MGLFFHQAGFLPLKVAAGGFFFFLAFPLGADAVPFLFLLDQVVGGQFQFQEPLAVVVLADLDAHRLA